jgi:hypothetical protein
MLKSKGRTARAESAQRQGSGGRRPKAWSRAGVLGAVSVGVIALGAAFSVPASAAPVAAASGAAAASFKIFNPPSPSDPLFGSPEQLTSIYAASPTDVWAVGQPAGDQFEHWNGTSWTGQGIPAGPATAAGNTASVSFITGTSASNITAVGTSSVVEPGTDTLESVAFHFNGTAWSQMTIPANVQLGPVLAFSATNLWSVNDNGDAEQFNGTTWAKTKLPIDTGLPKGSSQLIMSSISGSSPSDIWAAGTASTVGVRPAQAVPVLEHFNGTSWSNVSVPAPTGLRGGGLFDVESISPTDAYAVATGAILHWNGTAWTALNATTQTGAAVTGSAVAASSPTDVWIAGGTTLDNFNGTSWTSVPVPATTGLTPAGQTVEGLDAAAAVGPGTVWFVGNTLTPASDTSNSELPYALGTSNG